MACHINSEQPFTKSDPAPWIDFSKMSPLNTAPWSVRHRPMHSQHSRWQSATLIAHTWVKSARVENCLSSAQYLQHTQLVVLQTQMGSTTIPWAWERTLGYPTALPVNISRSHCHGNRHLNAAPIFLEHGQRRAGGKKWGYLIYALAGTMRVCISFVNGHIMQYYTTVAMIYYTNRMMYNIHTITIIIMSELVSEVAK